MREALRTLRGVVRSLRIYYGDRGRRAAMDRLYAELRAARRSRVRHRRACRRPRRGVPPARRARRRRRAAARAGEDAAPALRARPRRDDRAGRGGARRRHDFDCSSISTIRPSRPPRRPSSAPPTARRAGRARPGRAASAVPVTTLDALIARHGTPAFVKIDVEGFEAEVLAGLTQADPGAVVRVHHDPARRRARLPRALSRRSGYVRFNAALGESQTLVHAELAGRRRDRRVARRTADRGEFRRHLCATCVERGGHRLAFCVAAAARRVDCGARGGRSRGRRRQCERADAVRRDGQRLPQARFAGACAASRSRRCIRPTWAPSWSTAGRRISATATWRSDPAYKFEPRRVTIYETAGVAAGRAHVRRPSGARTTCRCGSATGSRTACTCCSCGRASRSAPRKCSCSIRPTAIGARARCRRRICAGAPTARRSWSGRSRWRGGRWSTSARSCSIRRRGAFRLDFVRGGAVTVRLDDARPGAHRARRRPRAVDLPAQPFAALRSMFVTEVNNDVAHIGWREQGRAELDARSR